MEDESVPGEEKPSNVDEFSCVVCAEGYKKPTLLNCMHTFCAECINQLVVQHDGIKTVSCPNCRFVTKVCVNAMEKFTGQYSGHRSPGS